MNRNEFQTVNSINTGTLTPGHNIGNKQLGHTAVQRATL